MRGFSFIQTPQNLCGIVFLLVFVAVISQATGEETTDKCDSDNTCWYVQPGARIVIVRSWRCLWLWKCWQYEVSTGPPENVCHCCPGWRGVTSDCERCPSGYFGFNCQRKCRCTDRESTQCDPRDGACYYKGNVSLGQQTVDNCGGVNCTKAQICNRNNSTTSCECPTNWRGENCDSHSRCPDGYYGMKCDRRCQCNNGTSQCDVIEGVCTCYRGWMGPACNETCQKGFYGENCLHECHCPANASECDPVSGDCLCPAGFYGKSCSSECPDGRFGPSCQSPCTCDNSTETCNRINGTCTDKDGPEVNANDDDSLPNSLAGAKVGAIVASALLVALLVTLMFLIKRRSKRANKARDTLAVKKDSGIDKNPCYDNPIDFVGDTGTSNSHLPLQHIVVGGATYAVPEHAARDSSSCNEEAVHGFEDSYNHVQPTAGDCINSRQYENTNDYSHLTRDNRQLLATRPADGSQDAPYAETTRVIQSKANEYDNLNRGVKQLGGVNKYEVVI